MQKLAEIRNWIVLSKKLESNKLKVFLIQDVPNLGKKGEIKEVKNTFAFNFLFPKGLAVQPNDPRASGFISEKREKKIQESEILNAQKKLAEDLNGRKFVILAKADKNGHLYGSIGPKELAKETGLKENLFKNHYKKTGVYDLEVSISGEIIKIAIEIKNI